MSQVLRLKPVQKAFHLFHYHFLSEQEPGNTLADLNFDTDIRKTLDKFRQKQWKVTEIAHYGFLSSVIFFVFIIFPASFLIKLPILAAFSTCFLIPLTSQFFLHALPIFTWLALFFSASKIPHSWKPAISVKFLPAMETILYGDNLSNVLAETNNSVLDVLAWLPYGIIHFASPFIVALFIFLFAPPTSLNSFGFAFGYMNLTGVFIQLLFPAAAPWYKNIHGLEPANYAMNGSPGGLGRIDELFGVDMYTTTFQNSPLVFGAFPSLHSGCAVMDVLFLCWLFPRFTPLWWSYAALLWWSTMYLTHHYFIDLIFGAALSLMFFTYVKCAKLPVIDPLKYCRWSYSELKLPDLNERDPLNSFLPLHNDLEADENLDFFNHPRFSGSVSEGIEMNTLGLPHDIPSRRPLSRTSSISPLELAVNNRVDVQDVLEVDTDHSIAGSVFDTDKRDDEVQISVTTSNTSVNDMLSTASAPAKNSILMSKSQASI
ncbi:PAP2-domain-containing protein [Metschnikowia bicuspidata var. bicuspidata NRRL YB-4993]|uniref:PAP2-domain-containing protein n=1 Tax=Metschnikowia bicuspidata var. bicuspidata NRRL YB-4993 TaxID=869754 RepID=A0A1A0H7C2_9ASCO|nr:PAP2-domain-containing protein [Metschnikowia bicuspidata var. bicuspidata NRRL YB-4993]OBA19994.1 PAP2-domain-containing protein [Metschnikowia bicuspidata var. bicuspidata NRRL YB-4993]